MELHKMFGDWEDQVDFPKGTVIFKRGDPGDYLYVVIDGEIELRVGDEPLAAETVGGIFGEMSLCEASRAADAVALRNCRVARITRAQFRDLVQKDPDLAIHLISVIANRLQVAVTLARM